MRIAVKRSSFVVCAAVLWLSLPAAADAGTGGAGLPAGPEVRGVSCVASKRVVCPAKGTLARDARARFVGSRLDSVRTVAFRSRTNRRVRAVVRRPSERSFEVVIPADAASGRVVLLTAGGGRAALDEAVEIADGPRALGPARADDRYFYGAKRQPELHLSAERPSEVKVELLRELDGQVVRDWPLSPGPGANAVARWSGAGALGTSGTYRFTVTGASAAAVRTTGAARFNYYDHIFPIQGKHNLGYTDTNNFGGGRNHQGQDMFAECGTPLVAARGGRVEYAGYGGAAGNYVVIDGQGTDVDYAYLHLRRPATVRRGQRVYTGQAIGEVGETGRAQGCHLHFEMWSGPGWYAGGKAFDPLPQVRLWDSYS